MLDLSIAKANIMEMTDLQHGATSQGAMAAMLPRICHIGNQTARWNEIRDCIEKRQISIIDAEHYREVANQYPHDALRLIIVSDGDVRKQPHETCAEIRREGYSGPILVITNSDDPVDPILALESGADAWMPLSADPRTAVAQVRALLRRAESQTVSSSADEMPASLQVGDCVMNYLARECQIGGRPISLTASEFQLLWILALRAGTVVKRDELTRMLGRPDAKLASRSIDCCVARLRKQLGQAFAKQIKTVRATGYLLSTSALAGSRNLASLATRFPVGMTQAVGGD